MIRTGQSMPEILSTCFGASRTKSSSSHSCSFLHKLILAERSCAPGIAKRCTAWAISAVTRGVIQPWGGLGAALFCGSGDGA
jgi:hypothetical protein